MSGLLARIGAFAPLLVFGLAAAESAAFVGLAVPGELAVILGGVASGTGNVPLWQTMTAAVAGAIVGDSIGYSLGRRTGPTLHRRRGASRLASHLDAASRLIGRRGWWAIVVARFVAVLRAVVPFAAGMGGMRYRRFLVGNVIGGAVWGVAFTLVGHFAGANYPTVERWMRRGGLAVAGVCVIAGAIVWATRWVQAHRDTVVDRAHQLAGRRPLRWVGNVATRSNRPTAVLGWTAVASVAGLWLFGGLVQDVLGSEEFFVFDGRVLGYLDRHRVGVLIAGARVIDTVTQPRWLAVATGALALMWFLRRHRRTAAAFLIAGVGQWGIVELTAMLVHRVPPGVPPLAARMDYGFPSEQVALLAGVAIVAAWPWSRPGWRSAVMRIGVATSAIAVTGISRVVLLVEYPSDVLAASAVAAAWSLLVCLVLDRRIAADT